MGTCRCGKDHSSDKAFIIEDVMSKLVQEVTDAIDQEIFDEIVAQTNPSAIPPLLKERK